MTTEQKEFIEFLKSICASYTITPEGGINVTSGNNYGFIGITTEIPSGTRFTNKGNISIYMNTFDEVSIIPEDVVFDNDGVVVFKTYKDWYNSRNLSTQQ